MQDKRTATPTDRLQYLGGQMNALLAFVAASVQSHPDRGALQAQNVASVCCQAPRALDAAAQLVEGGGVRLRRLRALGELRLQGEGGDRRAQLVRGIGEAFVEHDVPLPRLTEFLTRECATG